MSSILEGLVPDAPALPDGPVLDFLVERHVISKALASTASVAPNNTLIPVLKNFHLKLQGLRLTVTTSDTTMTALRSVDVTSSKGMNGGAVFPVQRLQAIVAEAAEDIHVKVSRKNEKYFAVLKSGTAKWSIPLMDPSGFPDLGFAEEIVLHAHPREPFLRALLKVRKAVSSDEMRPFLRMVDVKNGKMRASDSIRFQQVKYEFPFDCQIPFVAVHELVQRLSTSNEETFSVGETKNALLFRMGSALLVSQKMVAKFPDVDEVILKPTFANDLVLKVSRSGLLSAIRRVRVTADESTSAVVLSLNHGSVSIESKDRNHSVSVEEVEAEWEHAPRHVSFNHKHLTDMLSSTDTETCVFRLGKDLKTKPTAFLMEDETEGFTAVLSQIRLDWM